MKSIALEELALAHIINAEAEKAQAVTKMPIIPFTPDELIAFQHSVAKVLEMVIAKEALLLKKLRLLLAECKPCHKCRKKSAEEHHGWGHHGSDRYGPDSWSAGDDSDHCQSGDDAYSDHSCPDGHDHRGHRRNHHHR